MNDQDIDGFPLRHDVWEEIALRWTLAPQQKRVAEYLLRLHKDQTIARKMQLQLTTVRTYLRRLFLASSSTNRLHFMHQVWGLEKTILAEWEQTDQLNHDEHAELPVASPNVALPV